MKYSNIYSEVFESCSERNGSWLLQGNNDIIKNSIIFVQDYHINNITMQRGIL